MQNLTQPTLLLKPFAQSGTKNTIPDVNTDVSNPQLADLTNGFPAITSEDPNDGGLPPERADFNGLGYLTTSYDYFYQAGGTFTYNTTIASAIGGYPLGARLWYTDSNGRSTILRSTIENNTDNFNDGSETGIGTSWVVEIPNVSWNNTWTGDNTFSGKIISSGTNTFNGQNTFSGTTSFGNNTNVVTQATSNSSTKPASTEFVHNVASSYAYGAEPRDITELYDGNFASVTTNSVFSLSEAFTNFEELVVIGTFTGENKSRAVAYRISTYWLNILLTDMTSVEIWGTCAGDFVMISGYNASSEQSTTTSFKVRASTYAAIGKIYGVNRKV